MATKSRLLYLSCDHRASDHFAPIYTQAVIAITSRSLDIGESGFSWHVLLGHPPRHRNRIDLASPHIWSLHSLALLYNPNKGQQKVQAKPESALSKRNSTKSVRQCISIQDRRSSPVLQLVQNHDTGHTLHSIRRKQSATRKGGDQEWPRVAASGLGTSLSKNSDHSQYRKTNISTCL